MVQAASLFNQLLQIFPRAEFAALVKKHQAERHAKGFKCWTQFVAMIFCQLAHADSLRDICNGLACSEGKLVHLGIANAPNKSTLSYDQAAAAEVAASPLQGQVVLVQPGFDAAHGPVHLPGFAPVAGESLWHAAAGPSGRTAYAGPGLIWTGNGEIQDKECE